MNHSVFTTRREFMKGAASAAGALALPLVDPFPAFAEDKDVPDSKNATACPGILRLRLQARRLDELRRFYVEKLQLPVVEDSANAITFQAGGTRLTFTAVDAGEPIYHVAFNIPENKLAAAKEWMKPRTPLVKRPDGRDEYFFESWNAHAVYFLDPAGNILEFIARHNLKNAANGDFSLRDILYASEIGLVVDDVAATVAAARADLGFAPFGGRPSDEFAAVGTDHRLLIVVKRGRRWLGAEDKTAQVFQTCAALRHERNASLKLPAFPYEVVTEIS